MIWGGSQVDLRLLATDEDVAICRPVVRGQRDVAYCEHPNGLQIRASLVKKDSGGRRKSLRGQHLGTIAASGEIALGTPRH